MLSGPVNAWSVKTGEVELRSFSGFCPELIEIDSEIVSEKFTSMFTEVDVDSNGLVVVVATSIWFKIVSVVLGSGVVVVSKLTIVPSVDIAF